MKKFVSFAVTAVAMVLAFVVAGCNDDSSPSSPVDQPSGRVCTPENADECKGDGNELR